VQSGSPASTSSAALWNPGLPGWTDLGGGFAVVTGLDGSQQVGTRNGRAALWAGSAASYVDLQPALTGVTSSMAYSVAAGEQVGYLSFAGDHKAVLWRGSAGSFVSLNPPGALQSEARATDGVHQWGSVAYTGPGGRATRWRGTAETAVDFAPPGAVFSGVLGVGGGQQVGTHSMSTLGQHATLWNGTPQSWLDVHPFPGFGSSQLNATTGTVQVGWSHAPGFSFPRAGAWFGSAASFVDLTQFLPAGYGSGEAFSVTQDGDRTIIGGYANGPSGRAEAVIWTYVPAPGALSLLAAAGLWVARRRRA